MLKVFSVLFCCLGGHSGLYSYIVFRRPTVRSVESFGFRIFPRARSSGLPLPGFVFRLPVLFSLGELPL